MTISSKRSILIFIVLISFFTTMANSMLRDLHHYTGRQKSPTLVLLHGFRSNEEDLFSLGNDIDHRFNVFSLRAPIESGPSQYAWYPLQFTNNGPVMNFNEAEQGLETIVRYIRDLRENPSVDPDAIYLMGFSQGSIMSLFLALKYPELVRGVVSQSGRFLPEILGVIDQTNPKLKEKEILVVHGTEDKVISIDGARALKESVGKLPVQLEYHEFKGLGHSISGESLHVVKKFLKSSLDSYLQKKQKEIDRKQEL